MRGHEDFNPELSEEASRNKAGRDYEGIVTRFLRGPALLSPTPPLDEFASLARQVYPQGSVATRYLVERSTVYVFNPATIAWEELKIADSALKGQFIQAWLTRMGKRERKNI
jgi:hypothetical protein